MVWKSIHGDVSRPLRVPGSSVCQALMRDSEFLTLRRWRRETPVVASPNPGAREVTQEGRFGLIASDSAYRKHCSVF